MRWRLLILLLVLGVVVFAWARLGRGPEIAAGTTLEWTLAGEYQEIGDLPPLARLLGAEGKPFVSVLSQFAKLERDSRIERVVLRIRPLLISWAKAQELRDAIGRLREAGRKTVAYLEVENYGANLEYYVASAADEIVLAPGTPTPLVGLKAEYLFLGGFWQKLGIDLDAVGVGEYKSATEFYSGREMSGPHREMATSLLDSLHEQFVAGISSGRELSQEAVQQAIEAAPLAGKQMVERGLIDRVAHYDLVLSSDEVTITSGEYAGVDPATVGFEAEAQFALIHGTGNVTSGGGQFTRQGNPVFSADAVTEALEDAANDSEIRAIILRVDSPGGSAAAAEALWRAIRLAREKKPLVASFSDLAASAAYYAGAGADAVVAQPATLTGSIGAFALRPSFAELFNKLEIGTEFMQRGSYAKLFAFTQPLSTESRERFRGDVKRAYDLFVQRVAEGRQLDSPQVDQVARGRVWTGSQAAERGLIDQLGGLRQAVLLAKEKTGLAADADVALVPYPGPTPLAGQLGELLRNELRRMARIDLPFDQVVLRWLRWLEGIPMGAPVYLPPVAIEIR